MGQQATPLHYCELNSGITPMKQWSGDKIEGETLRTAAAAARETLSPVERLEMLLHPWVGFIILPLFAFANAGISLTSTNATSPITFAVFLGFVFGKPIGIVLFSWISVRLRVAMLPENMNWGMILGGWDASWHWFYDGIVYLRVSL